MFYRHSDIKPVVLIICSLALVWGLSGCARPNYKADADEKVYNIIDRKWKDEFGPKANYKVSDTTPSPNDVQVERVVPESAVLTLPQAVAIATAHNREYQTQREMLYTMALDLRLTRHEFETRFFGGPAIGYESGITDESTGVGGNAGFTRLLDHGTQIGVNLISAWTKILRGNLEGGLASILDMTATQPFLRGSDPLVVKEDLIQAERDTLYQVRTFSRYRKTFVVAIITQYYEVLQLLDTARNARRNYATLAWLYDRTQKLVEAGRLPKLELDQIKQEQLKARDIYIDAAEDYKRSLDELKLNLSLPVASKFRLDDGELDALRAVEMVYPDFSEDEAIQTAVGGRLDVINATDAVTDARRKVQVAADGLRGEGNITTDLSAGHLNDRMLRWRRDEYTLGLDVQLPMDRVLEQNIYRKALLKLNLRQREYEQAAETATLEVRQAYCDLKEATERYKVQSEALELAKKRLKTTFLLMQYGRASSRRVLNAQQALLDARNEAMQALVNYTVATLNFYRDTGVLQVRPDGMWKVQVARQGK